MSKRWRWLVAAVVLAAVLGTWSERRVDACAFVIVMGLGSGGGTDFCAPIAVAQQVTEIARMVDQLTELTSINEVLSADPGGHGNMPRLRELEDEHWWRQYLGKGLATSTAMGGIGLYNQRVPGMSDEPGWLNILSAPRLGDPTSSTVLLGGRPATETNPAEPSAFRTWPIPSGPAWSNAGRNAAREAIDVLGDVAEGTATWRTVWDDIEAALPNRIRAADLRGLRLARAVTDRMVETWRRRERRAAAELQHAHAIAEAASTLTAQVGETAAHLGELRDDDLMREQRVDQALLANSVTQTELLLAQAQLLAQEKGLEARERYYEFERERREREARWIADAGRAQTEMEAFATQSRGLAARRTDSFRNALLGSAGL